MNLVIVESPSKAKTINKYLGKDYLVKASKGHVVDLPKSKIGVNVEKNFEAEYEVTNKASLSDIKKAYKGADKLILAVDLDREGEAIGWHIAKELKLIDDNGKLKSKKPLERIVFHEISKDAILEALKNPRDIDMNLVNSQQGRRILDRLVGYKLSPLLWKKIAFGLSAGRVQSAALRLIVERERERNAFKPDEYWRILANLSKNKDSKVSYKIKEKTTGQEEKTEDISDQNLIQFALVKIDNKNLEIGNKENASKILESLKNNKWIILDISSSNQKRSPKPPFITSTFQQAAVNKLGFTAKRAMQSAQKLYEAGLITYMRTDSVYISNQAIESVRNHIKAQFGPKYLSEKVKLYSSSNKNAQEAHEAIRPVNLTKKGAELGLEGDLLRVYDLIWSRTIASQMSDALFELINADIQIDNMLFRANGKTIAFDGYLKVYKESQKENILPKLEVGEQLYPKDITASQHFTEPPARYSEATIIKKLEELGIGRPSTYASIISTIVARKYVLNENKYLSPTDTGTVVTKLLEKYFKDIVDYGFTAKMENDLDDVAVGKLDWKKMLKEFYFPFEKKVIENDKSIGREEFTVLGTSEEKCPLCGKSMVIKLGKYGRFLSCTDFPKCKGMLAIETEDNKGVSEAEVLDESLYKPAPKTEQGDPYVLKKGRFGSFWAHPDYPKVKDAKPLEMTLKGLKQKYGEVPKTEDGRPYLIKKGKFGEFWAHPDYPAKKDIIRIKKKQSSSEESQESVSEETT